jgi:hypothetical protein
MIEDFRTCRHNLQSFEPSPSLCLSFNAHDESNDVMERGLVSRLRRERSQPMHLVVHYPRKSLQHLVLETIEIQ